MVTVLFVGQRHAVSRQIAALLPDDTQLIDAPDVEAALERLHGDDTVALVISDAQHWDTATRDAVTADYPALVWIDLTDGDPVSRQLPAPHLTLLLPRDPAEAVLGEAMETAFALARALERKASLERRVGSIPDGSAPPTGRLPRFDTAQDYILMMAHDLRAPLTVIVGYANLLLESERSLSEQGRHLITRIRNSGDRLLHLITSVLKLAANGGKGMLTPEPTDLHELADHVRDDLQSLADDKRQRLSFQLKVPPKPVKLDTFAVRQILYNLVSNAINHADPGCEVTVCIRKDGPRVSFGVRDTGRGLPPAEVARLTEPRGDEALFTGRAMGGLGLSIVRRLVHLHGGEIRVETERGKGTAIRFTIQPAP